MNRTSFEQTHAPSHLREQNAEAEGSTAKPTEPQVEVSDEEFFVESPIWCRRHGDLFVVDLGSSAAFYLTRDEASEFAEMLEAEVTYRRDLGVEVLGEAGSADAPIMIADVSLTQQDARRLLAALQSVLDQDDEPMWHRVNWQEEGF